MDVAPGSSGVENAGENACATVPDHQVVELVGQAFSLPRLLPQAARPQPHQRCIGRMVHRVENAGENACATLPDHWVVELVGQAFRLVHGATRRPPSSMPAIARRRESFSGRRMILAIDIGGTKFSMAVFDGRRMVRRESRATDAAGGREWMLQQIGSITAEWRREFPLDRCGIGFGGPVNFAAQRVRFSTHVGGWNDCDLVAFVADLIGGPAVIDNDANVGAVGEAEFGAGKGFSPLFYMTLSTGIGGGIYQNGPDGQGEVWRGADSYGGEIGHLTIRPDGLECLCGARGCFERMCCGLWLERDYGRKPRELMEDPEFVKRYVVDLALGLKAAIMLLNPARIVIGGGIAKTGERLFAPLRAELAKQITTWSKARIDVVPAALGDDSVLFGALSLAWRLR